MELGWGFFPIHATLRAMRWFTNRPRGLRGGGGDGALGAERLVTTTKRRRFVITLLAGVAITGWLYMLFGSGIFRVTLVDPGLISDSDRGEAMRETFAALDAQGRWPWSRRNLLLVDTQSLSRELERRLFADTVAVEKSFPNVLRLKIQERRSSLVLVANNEFYLVDRRGVVSKRFAYEEEAGILQRISKPSSAGQTQAPILTVREMANPVPGMAVVPERTVQRWLIAFQELSRTGFGYRNAILEYATSTKLVLNMFEPYDVHFDLLTPLEPQIQSYYAFIKAKPPGTIIYAYVDARIPGRIYYR